MSTPEEQEKIYPLFLIKRFEQSRNRREEEKKTGKKIPQSFSKITDFTQVIRTIWVISNKDYQERFWVRREAPISCDCYMETMETFLSDGEAVLEANTAGRVSMTSKQRSMLEKLYQIVDDFDGDPDTPDDFDHEAIVVDPKWHAVRKYAKLVYEEITGEDLDAWEASKRDKAQNNGE